MNVQRRRALASTNRTRVARKHLKGALRAGAVRLAEVLIDPVWLLSSPISDVLLEFAGTRA